VALTADQDVDDRAVVEVSRVELGSDAALEERAPFLDLFGEHVEEVVALDPLHDLFLVVEGKVARDGAGKAPRRFFGLDQRHVLRWCTRALATLSKTQPT
jgi:hypothetical protein